ncbi:MAG: hypothetical protein ABI443_07080 [Chthoniobacterales bacterium]
MRRFLTVAILLLALSGVVRAESSNGAIALFQVLPAKYRNSVFKINADSSSAYPASWNVLARDYNSTNQIYALTISHGQILNDSPAPRQQWQYLFKKAHAISVRNVRCDSNIAWQAAVRFASSHGKKLGSVHYSLQQQAEHSAPYWKVECYDRAKNSIGSITVLASTGGVVSHS